MIGGRLAVLAKMVSMNWSMNGCRVPLLTRSRARTLVLFEADADVDEVPLLLVDGVGDGELDDDDDCINETVAVAAES
jgi:hypothetical protein